MMLPRHNGSGLALCSCSVLLPGIYAESGRHASYHQDSNPLSYVDRVGLDRFYNLRSPCTHVPEISTRREKILAVSSKVCKSSRCRVVLQDKMKHKMVLIDVFIDEELDILAGQIPLVN